MKKYRHIPKGKIACFPTDDKGRPKSTGWEEESKIDIPLFLVQGKDWEEVKDKPEWTVLSFKNTQLKPTGILSLLPDGKYGVHSRVYTLDHLLNNTTFNSIHSVRRESDGEVFTVGEYCYDVFGEKYISPIDRIWISFDQVRADLRNAGVVIIHGGEPSKNEVLFGKPESAPYFKVKEWEITALRQIGDGTTPEIFVVKNGVLLTKKFHHPISVEAAVKIWVVEHKTWEIYSVKRLSDNETFTIGEEYPLLKGGTSKIKKFYIDDEGASLQTEGGNCILIDSWRKVKPKEWEITAFKNKNTGYIDKKVGNLFNYNPYDKDGLEEFTMLKSVTYEIYSVKRLSDGVEFKIGDKVKDLSENSGDKNKIRTIERINIQSDGRLTLHLNGDMYMCWIKDMQKVEKLFTTEDGVDIYEGDSYAFVIRKIKDDEWGKDFELMEQNYALPQHVIQDREYPGRYFNFSNKKKAEEYILMNKPCLSINDVLSIRGKNNFCIFDTPLKQFVKRKLK